MPLPDMTATAFPVIGKTKHSRYDHSPKRRAQWDNAWMQRPIIAYDGEGMTIDGEHVYTLLASSDGHRLHHSHGIATAPALTFLCRAGARHPKGIHVMYGSGYDVNMILRDLSRPDVETLYRKETLQWRGYSIRWRPGRFLTVRHNEHGTITMYDVLPFFQCTFVKALDTYLGKEWEYRDEIIAGKARRGTFTPDDTDDIAEYNAAELRLLVRLVDSLRTYLDAVGIRPSRWYGPGAVASALLKREAVTAAMPTPRTSHTMRGYRRAICSAYAGGRFELIKYGHYSEPVWEYDVNSAYPNALRRVPNLANGTWRHTDMPDPDGIGNRFGVYRVAFRATDTITVAHRPTPLYRRHANGTISYPMAVEGWYHGPEIAAAIAYVETYGGTLDITEGWEYETVDSERPFAFVDELYRERLAYKRTGNGAHLALKLCLNSLYGKLAQQVGARRTREGWKIPPYHCMEWAGYVTAACRAQVFTAALESLDSVIAFETDALFSTRPLSVPLGDGLGQWSETKFQNMTYVQSGTYFATDEHGHEIARTRGVDIGSMTRADVLAKLYAQRADERTCRATLTRFIGAGLALAQDFSLWRSWHTTTKEIALGHSSKREHSPACPCYSDDSAAVSLHLTFCPFLGDAVNFPYPLAWVDGSPTMPELEELREYNNERMSYSD